MRSSTSAPARAKWSSAHQRQSPAEARDQVLADPTTVWQRPLVRWQHPNRPTAWYRKRQATFGDVLATVRRALWGNFSYSTSAHDPSLLLIPRADLARLAYAVCSSF